VRAVFIHPCVFTEVLRDNLNELDVLKSAADGDLDPLGVALHGLNRPRILEQFGRSEATSPRRNRARTPPVPDRMSRRALLVALTLLLATAATAAEPFAQQLRDVEAIRGLKFLHAVQTRAITREELPRYLNEQFEKSLPISFDDYMLVLTSLRFVDPAAKNPEKSLIDLMQQQVLAFYDPLTHVYFAIDKPPAGTPATPGLDLDDAVAVHELTHALQDQRFDVGRADLATRNDTDANLALHALVEGEASLVMLAKLVEPLGQTVDTLVKNDEMLNAISTAATMSTTGSGDTPRYFVESLVVPYTAGLKFVAAAYRRGGWAAVNRVYDNLPRSMREVMHPDEYFAGQRSANPFSFAAPVPVSHILTVEHLGQWHWEYLVGSDAARGWKGDRVTVAQDAFCNPTVLVETKWESPARANAFRDAYAGFLRKEKIDAQIRTRGDEVDVAYGADYALVDSFMTR
jgi:hypothetical protein